MPFLILGSGGGAVTIPVPRVGGFEEQPDGMGRRRFTGTTASIEQSVVDAVEALIGTPTGAESERAQDGTLLTDLPLVPVSGDVMTAAGVTSCEVRITGGAYRPALKGSADCFSRRLTLTLREA